MTTSNSPSLTVPASHALIFRDTVGNLLDNPLTTEPSAASHSR
jgi:hypothetical protein